MNKIDKRKGYIVGSIMCPIFLFFLFLKMDFKINIQELIRLKGLTLAEKPFITRSPGRYGHDYIAIKVNEISNEISISGVDFSCADEKTILNQLKMGDSIEVWVETKSFTNSQNHTIKTFKGGDVYNLLYHTNSLCDISCRNISHRKNQSIGLIAFSIIFIGCIFGVFLKQTPTLKILKYRRLEIEPIFIALVVAILLSFIFYSIKIFAINFQSK